MSHNQNEINQPKGKQTLKSKVLQIVLPWADDLISQ